MLTRDDLLAALRDCYDPEVGVNIVDLGLIEAIEIRLELDSRPRQAVRILLTLTEPPAVTDPTGAILIEQVRNRLAGLEGVGHVEVELASQTQWTERRISEAGRRLLRI